MSSIESFLTAGGKDVQSPASYIQANAVVSEQGLRSLDHDSASQQSTELESLESWPWSDSSLSGVQPMSVDAPASAISPEAKVCLDGGKYTVDELIPSGVYPEGVFAKQLAVVAAFDWSPLFDDAELRA